MVPRDGLLQVSQIKHLPTGATGKSRTVLQGFPLRTVAPSDPLKPSLEVRYWAQTRHDGRALRATLMTLNGHLHRFRSAAKATIHDVLV